MEQYRADTFAEELSWILAFLAGYRVSFPEDTVRGARIWDHLTFLGFHHLSDGKSLQEVYGAAFPLQTLGAAYRTFRSRTIWDDGRVDNHGVSPSLGYATGIAGATAVVEAALAKSRLHLPPLGRNKDKVFQKSIIDQLDIARLRHKSPVPTWVTHCTGEGCWQGGEHCNNNKDDNGDGPFDCEDPACFGVCVLEVTEDHYAFAPEGHITSFRGTTSPSGQEDWAGIFRAYNIFEANADYDRAGAVALATYHLLYEGKGMLFCGMPNPRTGQLCSARDENGYTYHFTIPLYAMLFSRRSTFK